MELWIETNLTEADELKIEINDQFTNRRPKDRPVQGIQLLVRCHFPEMKRDVMIDTVYQSNSIAHERALTV